MGPGVGGRETWGAGVKGPARERSHVGISVRDGRFPCRGKEGKIILGRVNCR